MFLLRDHMACIILMILTTVVKWDHEDWKFVNIKGFWLPLPSGPPISSAVMNGRVSEVVSTDLSGNENRLFLLTSIWRICRSTLKFMICLESVSSLNGSDGDPHRDSRNPASTGRTQVLPSGIPRNWRLAPALMPSVPVQICSSGFFPCEPGQAVGLHLPLLDGIARGQHLCRLGHRGVIVHAGHSYHLVAFGVKSHKLQLLQITLDDDMGKALSVPCGAGR